MNKIIEGQISFGGMHDALKAVSLLKYVRNGVMRISSHDASGMIGVFCGRFITGAFVTLTGETGFAALQKLLNAKDGQFAFLDAGGEVITDLRQNLGIDINSLVEAKEIREGMPLSENQLTGMVVSPEEYRLFDASAELPAVFSLLNMTEPERIDKINRVYQRISYEADAAVGRSTMNRLQTAQVQPQVGQQGLKQRPALPVGRPPQQMPASQPAHPPPLPIGQAPMQLHRPADYMPGQISMQRPQPPMERLQPSVQPPAQPPSQPARPPIYDRIERPSLDTPLLQSTAKRDPLGFEEIDYTKMRRTNNQPTPQPIQLPDISSVYSPAAGTTAPPSYIPSEVGDKVKSKPPIPVWDVPYEPPQEEPALSQSEFKRLKQWHHGSDRRRTLLRIFIGLAVAIAGVLAWPHVAPLLKPAPPPPAQPAATKPAKVAQPLQEHPPSSRWRLRRKRR